PVTISANPLSAVTVNVSVGGGSTASSPSDYQLLTSSLTFNPSPAPTTQNITVRVFGDAIGELNETVILSLSIGSGPATLGSITNHTLTINNDDPLTFYSCASGLTNAPIWSINDPTCSTPLTTAVFSPLNDFVIQSGHTVEMASSPLAMKSLEIKNGGKLWRNSSLSGNMRYVSIYDYLNNEGTFGNSTSSFDAIGINAEGANVTIYGGGTWNFGRIRKNGITPPTTNLTISDCEMNLYFPGTAIYNDPTNSTLNITINPGATVNVIEGNVAIDGTTGLSGGESFGSITVNGILNLDKNNVSGRGKFFGMTNNTGTGICNLTINSGGKVIVDEFDFNNNVPGAGTQFSLTLNGGQLEIREALNLIGGNFSATPDVILLSPDQNKAAIIDNFTSGYTGAFSGTAVFQRGYNSSSIFNQRYFSSPVNNLPISSFAPPLGTNGVAVTPTADCDETQTESNSNYGNVFEYNESLVTNCYLQAWVVRSSGNAENGRGYSVVKPGSGFFSVIGTPNLNTTYTLTGLGNSNWQKPTKQNTAPNATISGWHLLGNPYPANIDPDNPNPAEFGNIFKVLDAANGIYVDRTFSGSDRLSPFQGFFVYKNNNGATADFTFNASNRTRTATQFYKNDPLKQLQIKISNGQYYDECFVNIVPGATPSFDLQYDGIKWFSSPVIPAVYTQYQTERFSTNTIGSIEETPVVPLNFRVPENKTYTVELAGIQNLSGVSKVLIEDKLSNKTYEFAQDGQFTFSAQKGDVTDRFNIRFVAATVSGMDQAKDNIHLFVSNKAMHVDLGANNNIGNVEIFNALGAKVASFNINNSFERIDLSAIGNGTFVAYVNNGKNTLTRKFVIAE
ncbi:MAG: T9SS type A sorting domain-containing protein, partial [Chitinophagales bacterium]|nr:T9SS type A sorting domain-containing protein [Chitinophagales bacterium]